MNFSTKASRQDSDEDRIRKTQQKERKTLIDSLKVSGEESLGSFGSSGSE